MILVSFSSAEAALTNDVKHMTLLARKVLKIHHSAFLGHPLYHSAVVDKPFVDKIGDKTAILRKYDISTKILFC